MRFSRERSCSVEIPGSTRCSSTKRRGPPARSRTIRRGHLSPTRSRARASGAHWLYGWRFVGGMAERASLLWAKGNGVPAPHATANIRATGGTHPAFSGLCPKFLSDIAQLGAARSTPPVRCSSRGGLHLAVGDADRTSGIGHRSGAARRPAAPRVLLRPRLAVDVSRRPARPAAVLPATL